MFPGKKELISYETQDGKVPFDKWFKDLKDRKGRSIILERLGRLEETGNAGDCEPVGQGVYEAKIHFGPGYRLYFGEDGNMVILLCGGDKGSQRADIIKAQSYWAFYRRTK